MGRMEHSLSCSMDRLACFVAVLTLLFLVPTGRCSPSAAGISLNYSDDADTSVTGGGAIVTIELNKQYVPVRRNSKIVMYKAAYFGKVFVGLPVQQHFTVVFDTGSGHFFIPSLSCKGETCRKHSRYIRNQSISAVDIDYDGRDLPPGTPEAERDQVNIQYGTGQVTGGFSREIVCLGDHSGDTLEDTLQSPECTKLRIITASEMTSEPFAEFAFDGVAGLGLESLALQPEFSFFGAMSRQGALAQPRFGVYISNNDLVPSEISFGGHNERRVLESIHWTPVAHPEMGFWQVAIKRVFIGDVALEACEAGDCIGVVDTGSSLIGVPHKEAQDINLKLARTVNEEDTSALDCRNFPGPALIFDLGTYNLSVGAAEYSRPAALQVVDSKTNETKGLICRASLLPINLGSALGPKTFILGEPVLRKYYSVYDWKDLRLGFALSASQAASKTSSWSEQDAAVMGVPPQEALTPSIIVV